MPSNVPFFQLNGRDSAFPCKQLPFGLSPSSCYSNGAPSGTFLMLHNRRGYLSRLCCVRRERRVSVGGTELS